VSLRADYAKPSFLTMGSGRIPCEANYTVAGWCELASSPGDQSDGFYFWVLGSSADYANSDVAQITTAGNLRVTVYTSGWGNENTGSTTLSSGDRFHFALSRSGDTVSLYINGALEFTVSDDAGHLASGRGATVAQFLGNYADGGSTYCSNMRFYGWKAWTRALTAAEISLEQRRALPVSLTNLYGVWPFIGPTASVAMRDWSGHGHTWTDNNGVTAAEVNPPIPLGGEPAPAPAPSSSSGDISGTSGGVATVAAAILGLGLLTATGGGSATPSAALTGIGSVIGTTAGVTTTTGTLTGGGSTAGSSAGVATTSGTLTATGSLGGTSTGSSTPSGTLTAGGTLGGTAGGSATTGGTLTGPGTLGGTAGGSSTTSLTTGATGSMTGTAGGSATVTGTFTDGAILGSSEGGSSATATITATGEMLPDPEGGGFATVTGTLTGEVLTDAAYSRWLDLGGNVVAPQIPAGSQWRVVLTGPPVDQPCVKVVIVMLERNRP